MSENRWDFEKLWEYQQGALFLKEENSSLEWKKDLAEYFYRKGYEQIQKEIEILRHKQEQFESTISETIKMRDLYKQKLEVAADCLEEVAYQGSSREYCTRIAIQALQQIGEIK